MLNTITVVSPTFGIQILTVDPSDMNSYDIFPDNKTLHCSDFIQEKITITFKRQGHVVLGQRHKEKWVLAGYSCATVDLSSFSEHWNGCSAIFFNADYMQSSDPF